MDTGGFRGHCNLEKATIVACRLLLLPTDIRCSLKGYVRCSLRCRHHVTGP
jgi:hypothetical protein